MITEDDYLDFIVWVTERWKEQANVSYIAPVVKECTRLRIHCSLSAIVKTIGLSGF